MSGGNDSELHKYIQKLEARVEALEKSAETRMHNLSDWFKRTPAETPAPTTKTATTAHSDKELRMVLMGPPGAGQFCNSIGCDNALTVM
jgi:hypothetical protein